MHHPYPTGTSSTRVAFVSTGAVIFAVVSACTGVACYVSSRLRFNSVNMDKCRICISMQWPLRPQPHEHDVTTPGYVGLTFDLTLRGQRHAALFHLSASWPLPKFEQGGEGRSYITDLNEFHPSKFQFLCLLVTNFNSGFCLNELIYISVYFDIPAKR